MTIVCLYVKVIGIPQISPEDSGQEMFITTTTKRFIDIILTQWHKLEGRTCDP